MTHATSEQLCTLLDHMIWARSATEQPRPRHRVRLHALPPTMWIRPVPGVGGHKQARTGTLPATIAWHDGPLHAADPACTSPVSTGWTVEAAGTHLDGVIDLTEGRASELGRPSEAMWPAHRAPVLSAYEATRALEGFEEAGELARWSMLTHLEQFAHENVHRVAASLCREITGIDDHETAAALLDDQQLDQVVTHVIYGTSGPDSRILRSLDRCLDPATTRNVDPIRYLTTQIRRDLADQVRVAIGDPQVGPRVRRVARSLGIGAGLEAIIARYNQLHPSDRVSTTRAIRALTVAPSLESAAVRAVWEIRDV
ncbi:hypothetical protein ACIGH6_05815 [Brachybacterium paraconglomeratum]|uniref:hypothetical protein n=1 Tax=Brachybacterium TaxID=43668 RepID=UPI0021DF83C9|nr:hypothetical protein [Brachybacterium atlanticum]